MDSAQSAQTVSLLGLVALIFKHQLLDTQPLNRLNNIDIQHEHQLTFSLTFSNEEGETTLKQTRNTSVCGYDKGRSLS